MTSPPRSRLPTAAAPGDRDHDVAAAADIAVVLMKVSQNLTRRRCSRPSARRGGLGTVAAGQSVVGSVLKSGVPADSYVAVDGSGCHAVHVTAETLTAVLEHMPGPRHRDALWRRCRSPARTGRCPRGCTAHERKTLAKTGSISNVRALSAS
jgi:D-alanyl-D-alanine carboxypeptidase